MITEEKKAPATISRGLVKKVVALWAEKIEPGSFEWFKPEADIIDSVVVKKFRNHAKEWVWQHTTWSNKLIERTIAPGIERSLAIVDKVYTVVEYADGKLEILDLEEKYESWEELLHEQIYRLGTMSEAIPLGVTKKGIVAGKAYLSRNC